MGIRRQQRPPHEPCECAQLAARLAEYEADIAAMARTVVALRPILPRHTIEQGLIAWHVPEAAARRIAALARKG